MHGRGRKEWEGGNDMSNSLSLSSRVPATSEFFANSTIVPQLHSRCSRRDRTTDDEEMFDARHSVTAADRFC